MYLLKFLQASPQDPPGIEWPLNPPPPTSCVKISLQLFNNMLVFKFNYFWKLDGNIWVFSLKILL